MDSRHALALSLGLGVAASVLLAFGLLMMKSRAASLPMARGGGTVRAVMAWLRDPVWIGGLGVETAGYALYVAALARAPVSLMAVAMQGGIALFVVLAIILLGERARLWEWIGIGAFVVAALALAGSLGTGATEGVPDPDALAAVSAVALGAAAALLGAGQLRHSGAAAAIASGIAFGLGSLYTKALADALAPAPGAAALMAGVLASPYAYLVAAANVAGLVMLQNSFKMGRGIIAMPLSSAFSNIVPIAGGIAAFGERLPANPADAAMRVGAFALTIAAGMALAAGDLGAKAR